MAARVGVRGQESMTSGAEVARLRRLGMLAIEGPEEQLGSGVAR
ncbi:hypothetical protein [Ilumatobacter sp.]